MIQYNTEGITPTAAFIRDLHTGNFAEILPDVFMIKGAKNDRGFDQAYGLRKGKKDLLLIDAVEEAYREAVEELLHDGYSIKAILITGKGVLNDCYTDLATLSEDFGGADIYIHPDIAPKDDFETKALNGNNSLLSSFGIEVHTLPKKEGEVILYTNKHNGIVFTGDSAVGSDYASDEFLFTRGKEAKEKVHFQVEEFWQGFDKNFDYFFTRKGKPALEVDARTRTTLLDRLSRGEK